MKPMLSLYACVAVLLVAGCSGASDDTPAAAPAAPAPATAATTPAAAPVTAPSVTPVPAASATTGPHWLGYDALRWGMTPDAMQAAWQPGTLARPPGIGTDDTCHYLIPDALKDDVRFMVEEGHFVRAEFITTATTAPGGGKVGWTAAQVRAAYPDGLEEEPHKYEDGALYLRILGPDGGDGVLLFETDATGTVTRWRMGVAPQVDYVEGCA